MSDPTGRWVKLVEAAHDAIASKLDARKTAQLADVLETFEQDLKPHIAPFIAPLLDNPDVPAEVAGLLSTLAEPEHFAESVIIGIAIGSIIAPVLNAATGPTVQALSNTVWHGAATTPGNPGTLRVGSAVLAEAVIKGVLTQDAAAGIAANNGTSAEDFGTMVAAAGQSIGLGEALLLQRRNQLVGVTLSDVLQYNNLNPKFEASAENLIYSSPSTASALMGRTKNHLDDGPARQFYMEAGGNPANYDWELATVGRPLGIEQMAHLVNRGQATDADLALAAAQSDIALNFQQFVPYLKIYIPPPRSIVPMLRAGAITPEQGGQLLDMNGVPEPWKSAFITEATKPKSGTVKELSASELVKGYELGVIQQADATTRLEALGYNAADAASLIAVADMAKVHAFTSAAINGIRNRYVAYKIDQNTAQADLTRLTIPPNMVTQYLAVWNEDRAGNAPVLSNAQWQGALHRGTIDVGQFITEMTNRGYTPEEIKILGHESWPPTKTPPAEVVAALG